MKSRGFTLIEVVAAVALLSVALVVIPAFQGVVSRLDRDNRGYDGAGRLAGSVAVELRRLRDLPAAEGVSGGLAALARRIPGADSADALKLVASRDGSRVMLESDADNNAAGLLPAARFYLVEVRQLPAPLSYAENAGYLAVSLVITWPYRLPVGSDFTQSTAADPALTSMARFHAALTP